MTATELDEVQALLEHVLPDPAGYAQRVALQFMTRWGQSAGPSADASYSPAHFSSTGAHGATTGGMVIRPDHPGSDEPPVNTNILLAAALGACGCWGLQADCELCRGYGSAGWAQPDPQLFDEFVRPAIARLADVSADGRKKGRRKEPRRQAPHQTAQGVSQ